MSKMNHKEFDEAFWVACEEFKDVVLDAVTMIKTGRIEDGVALLERNFFPAWEDQAACEARYLEVMGRVG